jgi:hypothetical protein
MTFPFILWSASPHPWHIHPDPGPSGAPPRRSQNLSSGAWSRPQFGQFFMTGFYQIF